MVTACVIVVVADSADNGTSGVGEDRDGSHPPTRGPVPIPPRHAGQDQLDSTGPHLTTRHCSALRSMVLTVTTRPPSTAVIRASVSPAVSKVVESTASSP